MRFLVIVGLVLVVAGILILGYQGFSFITHEQVAKVGSVQITQEREHFVWFSPVAGIAAMVVGGMLVLLGRSQKSGAV